MDVSFVTWRARTGQPMLRNAADYRSPVLDSPPRLSLEPYVETVRIYTTGFSTVRRYEFERKGETDSRFRVPPGQGWRWKDSRSFPQGRRGVHTRRPGGRHFPYREV